MAWHFGCSLAQTVYTCLYVHHLEFINPALLSFADPPLQRTEERPLELTSLVIRAGVLGLVKCCDKAYRELDKGNVHDVRGLPVSTL